MAQSFARTALDVVGQQAAWWACALSAGAGRPGLGLAVTGAFVAGHLAASRWRGREAALLALAAVVGLAGDGALVAGGWLAFPEVARLGPLPVPAWMTGLWVAFAALLPGPLAWLGRDLRVAAVVGAVAGPLAYRGGAAFGGLEVAGAPSAWVAIATVYALALPLLALAARRVLEPPAGEEARHEAQGLGGVEGRPQGR